MGRDVAYHFHIFTRQPANARHIAPRPCCPMSRDNPELGIINRLLSVVRSRTDKSLELSRRGTDGAALWEK